MDTKKLRQKILDLAIHGKLVPQDPNDETASILLERIKTEKERLIKEGKIKRSKKSGSSDTLHYENVPFEVPSSWVWCRLGGLCNKFSTGPFGSMVHKSDYINNTGLPLINPANIIDGIISLDKVVYITESKANELERYKLEENDILLARRGDLSKCAIVEYQHLDAYCGTGSFVLHLENMNPKFFSIIYTSTYLQTILKSECVGATMDNLNQGVLSSILVPFPPMDEQYRIVTEIEKWFTLIDALEADSTDLQTLITRIKSKILDLAIHGKLVSQDPHDEPAVELLKRINPDFTPCDNEHYQNLPKGWAICRLEDIVDYEQPTAYIVNSTSYNDTYPRQVLTAGKSFIIGHTNEVEGIYSNLPCIIFDDFTTDSKLVEFSFKVKSSAMKILQVKKGIEIDFVAMFMSITRLIGDTHKRYWISEYSKLVIPVPPHAEQKRIIDAAYKAFTKLDTIMESL